MENFEFGTSSKARLAGVNPVLVSLMERALANSPIDFGIPKYGGVRTDEEQYDLYLAKKSKCDGYKIRGKHQDGNAVDVYAWVDGKASWDDVHLAIIAGVVLATAHEMGIKVRWGGTFGSREFKGWDKPHFELV